MTSLRNAESLGQWLLLLRTKKGLTQQEVADRLKLKHLNMVWRWENDRSKPDRDFCLPLARLYGVEVEELLKRAAKQ